MDKIITLYVMCVVLMQLMCVIISVTIDFILVNIVSWMFVAEILEFQRRANLLLPGQHESSVLKSIL